MGGALLTAFGPFPGAPENPTPAVIADAAGSTGARTLVLRTEYAAVPGALAEAASHDPDTVVMTGLFAALNAARIDYEISRDAGGYVCNFAYFHALRCFPAARVVFVHLPLTETAFARQISAGLVDGPPRQRLIAHAEAVQAVGAVLASQREGSGAA